MSKWLIAWTSLVVLLLVEGRGFSQPVDVPLPAKVPGTVDNQPASHVESSGIPESAFRAVMRGSVRIQLANGTLVSGNLVAVDHETITLIVPPNQDVLSYDRRDVTGLRSLPAGAAGTPSATPPGSPNAFRNSFQLDVKVGLSGGTLGLASTAQILAGVHRGHFTFSLGVGVNYSQITYDTNLSGSSSYPNFPPQTNTQVSFAPTLAIDVARFGDGRVRLYLLLAALIGYGSGSNLYEGYPGTVTLPAGGSLLRTDAVESSWSGGGQLGLGASGALGKNFHLGFEVGLRVQRSTDNYATTVYALDMNGNALPPNTSNLSGGTTSANLYAVLVGTFRSGE